MTGPRWAIALFLIGCGSTPSPSPGHAGAHHLGHRFEDPAQWVKRLEEPGRDAWQKPEAVIAWLGLAPDAHVADVGAGTGYFALRLAEAVPQGLVYAVDLEPGMVAWLSDRAVRTGRDNLRATLAQPADPHLHTPVDLIFVCDTWHHIPDRAAWLAAAAGQLRPGGRIVILDYKREAEAGPPVTMRLAAEQVIGELEAGGFKLLQREDALLPRQYLLAFGR